MGLPANLPSFSQLASSVAQGTGQFRLRDEPIDRFLGQLALRGVDVRRRALRELTGESVCPTPLHKELLRCFPISANVRVVTTNFDCLFEDAAESQLDGRTEVYTAPALPLGSSFQGIVHVHGSVKQPTGIVLTDADFGRAYLTEGWARRFLVDLFNAYTVLFVGYSHDDIVMSYLARALPAPHPMLENSPRRFALAPETDDAHWSFLGICPIWYGKTAGGDHSALGEGVKGLATYMRRGFRDWQRIIHGVAQQQPPRDQQSADLIADALSDPIRTRFFTQSATDPEWVEWLSDRGLLDRVFATELSGDARQIQWQLTRWLCASFARDHAEVLRRLLARHGMVLTADLWRELAGQLTAQSEQPFAPSDLSSWVSLLLEQIPTQIHDPEFELHNIAQVAAGAELHDRLFGTFEALAQTCLTARDTSESENWTLQEVWTRYVSALVDRAAERLLLPLLQLLRQRHRMMSQDGVATENYSDDAWRRTAIEPGDRPANESAAIDVVIDACRDCLEYLTENKPAVAETYIDQLARDESPLLRRIAVHSADRLSGLSADSKIDWLLQHIELHDELCRRELVRFLEHTYGEASGDRRESVLAAVSRYPDDGPAYDGRELFIGYSKLNWLTKLSQINPHCSATTNARDRLQSEFPDIQAHDSLGDPYADGEIQALDLQSPWNANELLAKPPAEWMPEIADFKATDPFGPSVQGLVRSVQDAASRDFDWGVALGQALVARQYWETDLWRALFHTWTGELGEERYLKVLRFLNDDGVFQHHPREVCRTLAGFVRDGNQTYAAPHLTYVNVMADRLWTYAATDADATGMRDWETLSLSRAPGPLTEFWLYSLSIGLREAQLTPGELPALHRTALETMLEDDGPAGAMAIAFLMSRFEFLRRADRDWTENHLLPLLTQPSDPDRYQAAWCGLMRGSLSGQTIELLEGPLLCATACLQGLEDVKTRTKLVDRLAGLMIDQVDDPTEIWIPLFMLNAGSTERRRFVWAIWDRLNGMADSEQRGLWDRWLRRYWVDRIEGVPAPLEDFEAEWMLRWLEPLHSLFAEAVELAICVPFKGVQVSMLLRALIKGDHWEREPDAVTDLLVHLVDTESATPPFFHWPELIERLTQSDASQDRREKLEELKARFGIAE